MSRVSTGKTYHNALYISDIQFAAVKISARRKKFLPFYGNGGNLRECSCEELGFDFSFVMIYKKKFQTKTYEI